MVTSQRCAHCGAKLGGAPAFCPSCGARLVRRDGVDGAAVELDLVERGSAPVESEVVFERPTGRRGRGIGLGVATALAVAIGASVLSGGDGGDTATPATTTVDPGPTTAADPPPTSGVTDATASTSTTALQPFVVAPGPLLGEPTGLSFAVALGTDLYVIDADTGRATPAGFGDVSSDRGAFLTSAGVVVSDQNGGILELVRRGANRATPLFDRSTVASNANGPSGYIGEGPPGRLWVLQYGGAHPTIGYVDAAAGSDTFVRFADVDLAYGNGRPDGIGGFVFAAPGGTYRLVEGDTPRRISTGSLVDASSGHVLVLECDEVLTCAYRSIDVDGGGSWTGPGAPTGAAIPFGLALSPDGRRFARFAPEGDRPIALGSDSPIEIVGPDGVETIRVPIAGFGACGFNGCASPMVWSPDGAWLLGQRSSDSIWAWRTGLDAPLVIELPADGPAARVNLSVLLGAWPTDAMPVGPA